MVGHRRRPELRPQLAEHGIRVTEDGVARVRAKLREADARMTPEKWQELREFIDAAARIGVLLCPYRALIEAARRSDAEHLPGVCLLEAHPYGTVLPDRVEEWRTVVIDI